MLLTLMMLPLPLADIPGANAATRKNAARTLLANRASNVATSRSGVAPNQANPALLTRMSISPTALTRRWTSAGSLRSAPTKRARPPAAVIASTVSVPRAASRPWTMTSAPSRASCKATARPMPDVAPVTRAVWPWRSRGWVAGIVVPRIVWLTNPSALTTALSGWWFPVARGAPPSAGYQAQALHRRGTPDRVGGLPPGHAPQRRPQVAVACRATPPSPPGGSTRPPEADQVVARI